VPSLTKVARVVGVGTLPETRRLIMATARSATLREVARRAVNDRAALMRDLRNPGNARDVVRSAARHPAARELATAGLIFLPGRYLAVGLAAWVARRVLLRYTDSPTKAPDEFDEVTAELGRTLDFVKVPRRDKEEALAGSSNARSTSSLTGHCASRIKPNRYAGPITRGALA